MSGAATRIDRPDRAGPTRCRLGAALFAATLLLPLGGCDPIWSISGAFFPAWLICMAGGLVAALLIRWVIARLGLEPHVGPRLLVYSMLYVASTCTLWLLFFAR